VYSCSGSAVTTTICNGRILMLEGEIPQEQEILAGAANAAAGLVKRAAQG
jgi:5-methylthioadenosine/S-adenosylhomocysteine deaminase